jgi:hypothetical protein
MDIRLHFFFCKLFDLVSARLHDLLHFLPVPLNSLTQKHIHKCTCKQSCLSTCDHSRSHINRTQDDTCTHNTINPTSSLHQRGRNWSIHRRGAGMPYRLGTSRTCEQHHSRPTILRKCADCSTLRVVQRIGVRGTGGRSSLRGRARRDAAGILGFFTAGELPRGFLVLRNFWRDYCAHVHDADASLRSEEGARAC